MKELTISEVAKQAGIHASAIRYYESVEILPAPRRINGRRLYDSSVLHRLPVIHMAQRAGFTISEIRTSFNGFTPQTPASPPWEALARHHITQVDTLILRARA